MKRKLKRTGIKATDALDLVPDNIGEGAQMAMAAEMSGMDYENFCMELVAEQEQRELPRKKRIKP